MGRLTASSGPISCVLSNQDRFTRREAYADAAARADRHSTRRSTSAARAGRITPVYHRRQYLLVPVALNNRSRQLFVLDTGMRFSTMTSETAHAISNMKVNFTNTIQTDSGAPAHVYRDSFDFQFANLALPHQSHVLEFDPAAINHNAGFEIGGLLGFDMLHQLTLQLDYRDGLVKFESTEAGVSPVLENKTMAVATTAPENGADESVCQPHDNADRPSARPLGQNYRQHRLRPPKPVKKSGSR